MHLAMGLGIYVLLAAALLDITTPGRLRAWYKTSKKSSSSDTLLMSPHLYVPQQLEVKYLYYTPLYDFDVSWYFIKPFRYRNV